MIKTFISKTSDDANSVGTDRSHARRGNATTDALRPRDAERPGLRAHAERGYDQAKKSVTEVAQAGEHHGDAGFIRRSNHFSITHRATWLDHRRDTDLGRIVQAVAEREKCIGSHYRASYLQASMFSLDRSNARRVHTAHLASADTDGLTVLGVDDGVGLDVLGNFPGKDQVMDFLFGRRTLGHDLQVIGADHADVAALHQQATVDALVVPGSSAIGRPLATGQQAHVGLGGDDGAGFFADARGNDHFDELTLDDGLGGLGVQFAVEGNDAAECRFGVSSVGQVVSLADAAFGVRADGHAARVGVLDDHAGWLDEALHAFQRGIGIGHVVVGQLFALQLGRGGDADFGRLGFNVERRALVRGLAVAHFLGLDELAVEGAREFAATFRAEGLSSLVHGAHVVGDHAVVGGGMFEGLEHQVETLGVGQAAGLEVFQDAGVIAGVDHDGHVLVVLGCRTNHGRAADVDVLDGSRQVATWFGDRCFEWVQVDRYQVDRLDAVLVHDGVVDTATTEDPAVDFRVQGFHPAVHHFGEAGVIRDFHCGNAVVLQQLERPAGGKDLDTQGFKLLGKFEDPGLVGNTDQGAADRQAGSLVGHLNFHQKQRSQQKRRPVLRGRLSGLIECLQQIVLLEFLAQRAPVQSEHFAGLGLVALDVVHHALEQGSLDFGEHQVVHIRDGSALKVGEIIVQRLLDTPAKGLAFFAWCIEVLFQIHVVAHGRCSTHYTLGPLSGSCNARQRTPERWRIVLPYHPND